jgi:cell shape-determining protein MreD
MVDSSHHPEPKRRTRPRWLKIALIVIAVVVIAVVVLALTGVFGAEHVPGPPAGGH